MKCLYVAQTHDDAMKFKHATENVVRFDKDDWYFTGIGGALSGRRFDYIEIGPLYFTEPRLVQETMEYLVTLSTKFRGKLGNPPVKEEGKRCCGDCFSTVLVNDSGLCDMCEGYRDHTGEK